MNLKFSFKKERMDYNGDNSNDINDFLKITFKIM